MPIVSWTFAGFTAVALLVYYLLPHKPQNGWLLLVSAVFYAWIGWPYLAVLAWMVAFNWLIGRQLAARPLNARLWLWLGIALNVLTLLVFKYFDFFKPVVVGALAAIQLNPDPAALDLLLPLGLSFTILQTISFLVDVSHGQLDPPAPLDFALYVAWFPKLISGPIERARAFLPQLAAPRVVDDEALKRSVCLILVGLFRKVVVADQLAGLVTRRPLTDPLPRFSTGLDAAIYLMGYGFYLYNDFAGYTGIVRGVSGLFGIELSPNFLTPYFSRSFSEFWSRWHISLSEWLRDYVYFPLTRALLRRNVNPRAVVTLVVPPLVTMLISALWHGVSLPLLVWGLLYGVYLAAERVIASYRPARPQGRAPLIGQVASALLIYVLVNLAWIPFHSATLTDAAGYLESLTRPGRPSETLGMLSFVAAGLILDVLQRISGDELFFRRWPRPAQVALLAGTVLLLVTFAPHVLETFVYQGF